ncbi:transcription factor CYCLOIDEA [Punica granatum]|uniref:Uncharacterized protein n=2 Tax=Punica granatum TaxID=22663 RepID=A0A218VXZ8_PUNGR|nr:transcription factor CYCLOIDEA [Punica granatum]OWM65159.1 hypothetical protein CDL15_Pgr008746 [Punica granatum]PKI43890.1 hypothetical protein CRG98_035724 [Punica granatum]
MFPSSHNANDPNIVSLPFLGDLITNSKQDQDLLLPLSLFNFPSSPFSFFTEEDGAVFLQPLTDHSLPDTKVDAMEPSKQFLGMNQPTNDKKREHHPSKNITKQFVPRKRSSKKDRHSKINTAQGPRDRRMRLSLDVARKFFYLQDMLGFDKASKTVEWLLNQSKSAIKELSKDLISNNTCKLAGEESSPSECDVVSGVFDESVDAFNNDGDQPDKPEDDSKGFQSETPSRKVRKASSSQASTRRISPTHLARESREKARARAKERTREKMLVRELNINNGSKPFEMGEEPGTGQLGNNNMKLSSMEVQAEVGEAKQLGAMTEQTIDNSLAFTSNYMQSNVLQENQFRDFPLYLRSSEAFSGSSYLF